MFKLDALYQLAIDAMLFLFKYEKEIYKLKHFLFQYISKVLAGTHLINEICLNVYPILFFICKIYFLNKHILMTCLGVQSISYPEYLQINRMMNIHYTVTGNKVYYTNIWAGGNHTTYLSHWITKLLLIPGKY